MEAPKQIEPQSLADHLDVLTRAVFQSGLSWRVVEAKWPGFQRAFAGFDPDTVAAFGEPDIDRLSADTGIIRNRRKIEATVENAQTMAALDAQYGGFRNYLRSQGGYEGLEADMKKRFRWLGDLGVYYFLYVVGEAVPPHEEWMAARGRTMEARGRGR